MQGGKEMSSDLEHRLNTIITRINEMDSIWMFFQRFVDEQGNDKLKMIRGTCYTMLEKINSIEWLARYTEFVTPETINMAANYFKDYANTSDGSKRKKYVEYEHTSEAVPTIIQKIKSKDYELSQERVPYKQFDDSMVILLMLLEPLIINDDNLDMMIAIKGASIIGDLMLI